MTVNPYRQLPSVDALAANLADDLSTSLPRALLVDVARTVVDQARADVASGDEVDVTSRALRLVRAVERSAGVGVVNATGVLLHTNLGRALWSETAIAKAMSTARSFTNLELDLDTGQRGRRGDHVTRLLRVLTGAEDALVVNNNAAALLLVLATTARGRAVPVSRGELIEIGGSYRLPDVMAASGARLIEVGTTNRTRVGDYQTALQTHDCGALLKVHPSNYRIDGFIEEGSLDDLAGIAWEVPLIYDLGSGLLDASAEWVPSWIEGEPAARQSLEAGADLVMFSGDKLLGGPQAGVIVGRADLVDRIRANPMTRALRVDGVTYAALTATLESYARGLPEEIPFWRHALTPHSALQARAETLATTVDGEVVDGASRVGAGSAPDVEIPGPLIRLPGRGNLFELLLDTDRPVLTRRIDGDLVIDLRAVEPADDDSVRQAIEECQ